jgi:hypothetical protein
MTELEKCQLAKAKGYTYCPVSGELIGVLGNVIRTKCGKGYTKCSVFYEGKHYNITAHRLAWYLHYGHLPINQIDHIDGVRSNNKIDNLRDVTCQQNQWNKKTAKGYSWSKWMNKFRAHIGINGKLKIIGYFNTEQEARAAYLKAKENYHIIA